MNRTGKGEHEFGNNNAERLEAALKRMNGEGAQAGVDGRANDNVRPVRKTARNTKRAHAR